MRAKVNSPMMETAAKQGISANQEAEIVGSGADARAASGRLRGLSERVGALLTSPGAAAEAGAAAAAGAAGMAAAASPVEAEPSYTEAEEEEPEPPAPSWRTTRWRTRSRTSRRPSRCTRRPRRAARTAAGDDAVVVPLGTRPADADDADDSEPPR